MLIRLCASDRLSILGLLTKKDTDYSLYNERYYYTACRLQLNTPRSRVVTLYRAGDQATGSPPTSIFGPTPYVMYVIDVTP